jgi:hypothetical protein
MTNQMPTIVQATSDHEGRLPVIDITHPAFAVDDDPIALAREARTFVAESSQRREIPPHVRELLQRSRLGSGLNAAAGSFLTGLSTYLLKLGPDNLGDGFADIDRRIAASFPAFMTRVRLQDVARLLAAGVAGLAPDDRRRLQFINIAGGPAADSWNALIQLRATQPGLLDDRPIAITVLDLDTRGPAFGACAIDALQQPGAPLHGLHLDLPLRHVSYDWSQADRLPSLLADLGAPAAACAISSEGGLFQYGTDADIIANLAALRAATPADAFVVGTVTSDDEPSRLSQAMSQVPTRPMAVDTFRHLASTAGWSIAALIERPFVYAVRLIKAA